VFAVDTVERPGDSLPKARRTLYVALKITTSVPARVSICIP
jgi:hypothetical protein